MDVFKLRNRLVSDYAKYTRSFIKIADNRIREKVDMELDNGALWPEPLLQLNPNFKPGGTIDDMVAGGILDKECARIFRIDKTDAEHIGKQIVLHTHQTEAIRKAKENKSYVLTCGTGSGKSLAYIVPLVDHILRNGSKGIQAIVVYPMNALANSQHEELTKFLIKGYGEGDTPVSFARYTGQEKKDDREAIRANPPDILLTNYMMLELLLTRSEDRELVRAAQNVKFLVFDELHTYRGRQGADVAMLIRRCRLAFGGREIICIGTSATMASGGLLEKQKKEVASVAQTLFGTSITADQVIGETLARSTPEIDFNAPDVKEKLTATIENEPDPPDNIEDFRNDPLTSWIESTFGVQSDPENNRLVRQTPRQLCGKTGAAQELAKLTSTSPASCATVLQNYLLRGSKLPATEASRFPIFAFRLHQFFTRGDTVWATMEPEATRHLELSKLVAKPGEPEKPLFPLVFCRQCGTAYYRIATHNDEQGRNLHPCEDFRFAQDDGENGYLYISSSKPWPRTENDELMARLPSLLKEPIRQDAERIRADARKKNNIPEPVFVDDAGKIVSEGKGMPAAIITGNFLFCLNCQVAYTRTQRSEKTKLGTLGVDNRSTATTILAVRSLIELSEVQESLSKKARKLLSFTDNRQDASLQAGHFNDFSQVALLRSALYKAAESMGARGLNHGDLSRRVFEALELKLEEYAADPEVRGSALDVTHNALRRVIYYHLYRDLQQGWRVTAPNLEDCGLLQFEYDGLCGEDSLLGERQLWTAGFNVSAGRSEKEFIETPAVLRACTADLREELLLTLLTYMRRSLAINADSLNPCKQFDLIEQTKPRLLEGTVWCLEDLRELVKSTVAYPRAQRKNRREDIAGVFISSHGRYGQYLKNTLRKNLPSGQDLTQEKIDQAIRFLFQALKRYGIAEQVRSGDIPGYQINPDALRWVAGSGEVRPVDRTRLNEVGETSPEVNEYFKECYRNFINLKCVLEAREHTAQVTSEDREEREKRFREGDLPLLFCSPTMELGIDIAQLNLVNLRNVPPTPANYAQRSGRAGRSGQSALVYTYCAGRSPHDQYYFRRPDQMVAGAVAPPRIDLCNRDLIRSHIHAIWMEVAKPELGKTLINVLDTERKDGKIPLPVKETIRHELTNPVHRAATFRKANELVESISEILSSVAWYHENWTKDTLDQIELSFNAACDRWRELYRSAVRQRELHHKIIGDHSRPDTERKHSKRLRDQAENQIRLLTQAEGVYEGDFYTYRYFATEGFLPGYNFPRLPISAYVPGRKSRKGRNEFVSRPRFLAISEFGPRAFVYHEGARYQVYKANLDFGSDDVEATHNLTTDTMKRCTKCGYAHIMQGKNLAEICDRCGSSLDGLSVIPDMVHLQNVNLRLYKRITCDEEERQRFGYRLVSSYRFPQIGGQMERRDSEITVAGVIAMRLSYGDATDLYRINLGWASQKIDEPRGFVLDLEKGYWASNKADPADQDDAANLGRSIRVVPFVKDTKNALVMGFEPECSVSVMAALQAAFKMAIQQIFQLEARELFSEAMPSPHERKEILFYEATEGGAGVLRQLVEDAKVMPALARRALEICHFDPDTLADLGAESCGKACYKCLLDYANQPDHALLDRHEIRDILANLAQSKSNPAGGAGPRPARMAALRNRCDSKLEKKWLDQLDPLGLRLPSGAQHLIESCSTRPDFFYQDYNAAIYIDGPPHDEADNIQNDEKITERLLEAGYIVIRFHHIADWEAIFRKHPDIFGEPSK